MPSLWSYSCGCQAVIALKTLNYIQPPSLRGSQSSREETSLLKITDLRLGAVREGQYQEPILTKGPLCAGHLICFTSAKSLPTVQLGVHVIPILQIWRLSYGALQGPFFWPLWLFQGEAHDSPGPIKWFSEILPGERNISSLWYQAVFPVEYQAELIDGSLVWPKDSFFIEAKAQREAQAKDRDSWHCCFSPWAHCWDS